MEYTLKELEVPKLDTENECYVLSYTKKDGSNGTVYEVVADSVQFLEPKGSRTTEDTGYTPDEAPAPKAESKNLDAIDVADDDFPF